MNYSRNWRLIQDPRQDAFTNMAVDEAIARVLANSDNNPVEPSLRIYTWKPDSVSIGYFQKISDVISSLGLNGTDKNCDIVRRPTGGMAVVHDGGPSFSLVLKDSACIPSTKMSIIGLYSMLGRCVVETLRRMGISAELWNGSKGIPNNSGLCVSSLCPYDVVSNGRKVAGYAARRFRGATLLQGYIYLTDGLTAQELQDAMIAAVEDIMGANLLDGELTEEERTLSTKLRDEKYTRREWNYKR